MKTKFTPAIIILLTLFVIGIAYIGFEPTFQNTEAKHDQSQEVEEEIIMDRSRDHEGDTFSVVAYDPNTGEIGGAGTSCYSGNINFLNDIIRSPSGTLLGAIHTQAAYTSGNQNNARARMLAGDTPAQIVAWLAANDCCSSNANSRQYGIVGISNTGTITTAGYTGSSNGNWAGHITGIDPNTGMHYAIQGNILDTNSPANGGQQDILNDMETSFRNSTGNLADKLMAALQGAKRVGGDNRCQTSGNSGRASFIRVLRPSDATGNPYIDLWDYPNISLVEPIDVLQCTYDAAVSTPFCRTTISTFPYTMDFETKSWEQESITCSVNSSWIRSRYTSPSSNTGPAGANQGALYAFVEASDVGGQGTSPRSAILGSPCFNIPSNHTAQMTFDYHMFGTDMGTLSIQASNNGGSSWSTLWTRSGNQGSSWFNNEVINLSAYSGTTVKLRVNALMGNGFTSDMAIDDIQITVQEIPVCTGVTKTWNGTSWSPTGAPTSNDIAIINGPYNTSTNGNVTACTLTINSGRTFTVGSNSFANIEGDITVDGNLIIKPTGSLVQQDQDAVVTKNTGGVINVELTTPVLQTRDFMVMGSPMTAETRNDVFTNAFLVLNQNPGNFIPHPGVPAGGTNFADDNNNFWTSYNGNIDVGKGYIVRPQSGYTDPANHTYAMTYTKGTLNNGVVSRPIFFNGLGSNPDGTPNVLANPYPSAISAIDLINANPLINEIYFWEHLTAPSPSIPGAGSINFSMDDISMYNLSGGVKAANDPGASTTPNGVISTGQGFAIKAMAAGTVSFDNSMRLTSGNTTLRNPADELEIDRIWINVRNAEYEIGSNALIAFNPTATPQWDAGYDSQRLATAISLYSHIDNNPIQLGIQTRESFDPSTKISMGFASQVNANAVYTISLENMEGMHIGAATVYLLDNETNILTNLSESTYEFESNKGTFDQRFTLMFESDTVLGTAANILTSITTYPNPTKDVVTINSPYAVIKDIVVYDLRGRKVFEIMDKEDHHYVLNLSDLETAIYFVKISTEVGSITKKVIKK